MPAPGIVLLVLSLALTMSPRASFALKGDCGQPVTDGTTPAASDALFILGAAVGLQTCAARCMCDTNGNGSITAGDALRALQSAVAQQPVAGCICPRPPCSSGLFTTLPGSRLDIGWNGMARDLSFLGAGSIPFEIVRRCVDSPETVCSTDADCPSGSCLSTCDCDDPNNSVCEITSAAPHRRCLGSQNACETNADCASFTAPCDRPVAPPQPVSAYNTPFCVFPFLSGDVIGTVDPHTGASRLSLPMHWAISLGIALGQPCPRCGPPDQNPQVGQSFACEDGLNHGQPCVVELVTPPFGGTSSACPEQLVRATGFKFLANSRFELSTGTVSRTATFPCIASGFCIDDSTPCSTNTDCRRCTNSLTACAQNADCAGDSVCAAAPEQPISCGFYCHCGFCEHGDIGIDEPTEPCFDDLECGVTRSCTAGDNRTGKQEQPSACADLACGRPDDQRCCVEGDPRCEFPTPAVGKCSQNELIMCADQADCASQAAGDCLLAPRACFESAFTRTGTPSSLGGHCTEAAELEACDTNADCQQGSCVADTVAPTLVALFCSTRTSSGAINAAMGLPGPGALTLETLVRFCRCGDGVARCAEECDDGDQEEGDGCDRACRIEAPLARPDGPK